MMAAHASTTWARTLPEPADPLPELPSLSGDLDDRDAFRNFYDRVRGDSEALAAPLHPEDMVVQTMDDVSPTKWHLAHTSWFFETFLLKNFAARYTPLNDAYNYLFNSYYNGIGAQFPRPRRGLLSRPTVAQIAAYRAHVDDAMARLIAESATARWAEIAPLIVLGLHHEQQHQELIATDIKHVLAQNPLAPAAYMRPQKPATALAPSPAPVLSWQPFEGGIYEIGHNPQTHKFTYDNEGPRHEVLVRPFTLASRPVTNGEYRAFVEDGGYRRADLWLSDGWATILAENWEAPLYWRQSATEASSETPTGAWSEVTLFGQAALDPDTPATHLSYYEATAYAAWAGKRLPSEAELEIATRDIPIEGNFAQASTMHGFHPEPARQSGLAQLYGDVWEWTSSSYSAYPGYRPAPGAVGEYNGKFMCNQFVLRGGSCATPYGHIRPTYRNFFPPASRWQFSGLRLADDL